MGCLIKITSIREATDREPNFATTEVSEIKSGLEKRCSHLVADEKGQNVEMLLKVNKKVAICICKSCVCC